MTPFGGSGTVHEMPCVVEVVLPVDGMSGFDGTKPLNYIYGDMALVYTLFYEYKKKYDS